MIAFMMEKGKKKP